MSVEDEVDGVGAARIQAGRGWIGMYMNHHIDFGIGGMESIVVGVDTGEI